MNPAEFARQGRELSDKLNAAEILHKDHVLVAARAERDYRHAKSEAWVRCPNDDASVKAGAREWTAARREAWVNGQTADLRYQRDIAEGMVRHALQVQRNALAQLSLLQTSMNAFKAEAEFSRSYERSA